MEEKTVKDHEGKKIPADTARVGGAAYAPHDQDAEKLAKNTGNERKAGENAGDDRTPEKTIGEIKYAEKADKKHGGSM
jgi:hypothetical protein